VGRYNAWDGKPNHSWLNSRSVPVGATTEGAIAADWKVGVGSLLINNCFRGDVDQPAEPILPSFYHSHQAIYWAFREEPDRAIGEELHLNAVILAGARDAE
jgi:hypothetical protein